MSLTKIAQFPDRLKEALHGRSGSDVAERIGLSKQAISMYLSGSRNPKRPTIEALARELNVSPVWLSGYDVDKYYSLNFIASTTPYFRIPIIGTVRCGYGGAAFEEVIGHDYADVKNPEEYMFFKVKGDSMQPKIEEGDLALVHRQPDVESGELAVVIVNGDEGTLKRIIKQDDAIILQAFNPSVEPKIITGKDLDQVHICGKVVETKKKW